MLNENDNSNKRAIEKTEQRITNIMKMLQSATLAQLEELEVFINLYIT